MGRKKQAARKALKKRINELKLVERRKLLLDLVNIAVIEGALFTKDHFHGNTKWLPEHLAVQAMVWSWQDTKNVTDAFEKAVEICDQLGLDKIARTYTAFMNALSRYRHVMLDRLRVRRQELAQKWCGRHFRTDGWALIGFDGSRITAPRSTSNEKAFCAPNHGKGKTAKYKKKLSKGMRRKRDEACKPTEPEPQVWITMMWHMGLRMPWSWRLGPSNSSERGHVQEMLEQEEFPEDTLFCGDAGFVGYPLWSSILEKGGNFLVRVGGNVELLSEHAQVEMLEGGIVLCWPKDRMRSGEPPLRLRLVRVTIGKTKMWMLTSVLDEDKLSLSQIVRYYKMRWLIEVEFRGLKQTIDKHSLRCRNKDRLLVELDWSLQGMAYAELLSSYSQIQAAEENDEAYDSRERSLANTLRVLRRFMRRLIEMVSPTELMDNLAAATVQRYNNRTDKRSRYRPKNPDKKPLADPQIRTLTAEEREKLRCKELKHAA